MPLPLDFVVGRDGNLYEALPYLPARYSLKVTIKNKENSTRKLAIIR